MSAIPSDIGVSNLHVEGFRSARDLRFTPKRMCALVGEARSGKSTMLAAIRAVLDPQASKLATSDITQGASRLTIRARLASGETLTVQGPPFTISETNDKTPVVYMPAALRDSSIVAPSATWKNSPATAAFGDLIENSATSDDGHSTTSPALGLVETIEKCCLEKAVGMVILIEEPEIYLRPQTQRYLYRLLRQLSHNGNQVIYSTHAPSFLNVARLDELAFVTRGTSGTQVTHAGPIDPGDEFRLISEFDSERSEVFLAQAAILVEGTTEKLALPFVFQAMGYDPDRLGITIVECGGKSGIPFVARVCAAAGIPFVAVHDRDALQGSGPNAGEDQLNRLIADTTGADRTVLLEPDFEAISGIRGHTKKPRRAWKRFTGMPADAIPGPLKTVVEIAVGLLPAEHELP